MQTRKNDSDKIKVSRKTEIESNSTMGNIYGNPQNINHLNSNTNNHNDTSQTVVQNEACLTQQQSTSGTGGDHRSNVFIENGKNSMK